MSNAVELFETLRQFQTTSVSGLSPERSLFEHCQTVLGAIERIHFDFKEKDDRRIPKLGDNDRANLAKAVSGFANSSGGVLIWGIEDKTIAAKPISLVAEFVDGILQLAHQVTSPAVRGIDGDFILSDGSTDAGFALVLIPESQLPPHRVELRDKEIKNHYYVRSGSSFTVATHSQLEDMFGRRPKPILTLQHIVKRGSSRSDGFDVFVTLKLENQGRGIARYPFLAVRVEPPHGISLHGADGRGRNPIPELWHDGETVQDALFTATSVSYGSCDGLVIHSGMSVDVTKVIAKVSLGANQKTDDLKIDFEIAAEGMPIQSDSLVISATELVNSI